MGRARGHHGAATPSPGDAEAGLLKQTGRVCYSYRRPELCSLLKCLAPQLLKNPLVLGDK